jgi:hypothetical protein
LGSDAAFDPQQIRRSKEDSYPMEQQASQWISLAIALVAGAFFLFRNFRPSKERRSIGQAFICMLYKIVRFFWAVVRAVDIGYLEYRRVVTRTPLEMENEKELGKLIQPSREAAIPDGLDWSPAQAK